MSRRTRPLRCLGFGPRFDLARALVEANHDAPVVTPWVMRVAARWVGCRPAQLRRCLLGRVVSAGGAEDSRGCVPQWRWMMPGPVSESYTGPMDREEVELRRAIRTFTVEAPDDEPNGETERHVLALREALEHRNVGAAQDAFCLLMGSLSADVQALRRAAEAYFGGDFRAMGGAPGERRRGARS